jgi:hypothetical protein
MVLLQPLSNNSTSDKAWPSTLNAKIGVRPDRVIQPSWRSPTKTTIRDSRACKSCYFSPHPRASSANQLSLKESGFGAKYLCPPCEAARQGRERWIQRGTSTMKQVDIIRKTRDIFQESGRVPQIHEIDPLATADAGTPTELEEELDFGRIKGMDSADDNMKFRAFFAHDASELFSIPRTNPCVSSLRCFVRSLMA